MRNNRVVSNKEFIMKPKVDFCFKELMADEMVRRGFVSTVLGIQPEKIRDTKLMPTILEKKYLDDKIGILDVRVWLKDLAQHLDIEIQVVPFDLWAERSVFYVAKMFTEQIKEGEGYKALEKCIHVGILDFEMFKSDKEFYSRFHLWEDSRRCLYTDKLEMHILELPKLKKHNYPDSELLRWAKFINAESREELQMLAEGNKYLKRAYEKLEVLSADEQKRLEYEAREKAIRDYNTQMETRFEAGQKSGWEDGKKEGERIGREKEKINNARNLLDILDAETIAERLELPLETVIRLKNGKETIEELEFSYEE